MDDDSRPTASVDPEEPGVADLVVTDAELLVTMDAQRRELPGGWVAITAGVFSILGQISVLAMLFMVAILAYLLWYIGLTARFSKLAKNA